MYIKVYHSNSKASQYKTCNSFKPFKCFYCDRTIDAEDKSDDHQIECAKEFDFLLKPQLLYSELNTFKCECCGAECRDDNDLRRHLRMYHPMKIEPQEIEKDWFECDSCPLKYEKQVDLVFHKRGFHWGQS